MVRKKMGIGWKVACLLIAVCLAVAVGTQVITANAAMMAGQGVYYSDFEDMDSLQKEAAKLGQKIGEEGMTLLKNKDDSLPLDGNEGVNVFGVMSDKMVGSSETVADVLEEEGFRVNRVLANYYEETNTTSSGGMGPGMSSTEIGDEKTEKDFPADVLSSMNLYKDVAVIVISRDGAEGDDLKLVTDEVEDNKYIGEDRGWTHKDLKKGTAESETPGQGGGPGGQGGPAMPMAESDDEAAPAEEVEFKHYLQLTESEEELIGFAKEISEKVVVVLNTSNVIEAGDLQNDDGIDGIVWIGRTGDSGLSALAKILNGTLNPSGRTTDIWTKDHTADPTWINYATGVQVDNIKNDPDNKNYGKDYAPSSSQNNYQVFYRRIVDEEGNVSYKSYRRADDNKYMSGPDMFYYYAFSMYEEGIYMGYRYYETYAADMEEGGEEWYDDAVVYPFGYGLSYATFEWENVTPANELENWQTKKTLNLQVKVTNTGNVAGKDVVQVYSHAPYFEGEVEKPEVQLVGFGKTNTIQPDKSQTITITVNVQDIANFDDYDKNDNGKATYELDAGSGYELRLQANSHDVKDTIALSDLAADAILDKDDFSDKPVEALFTGDDEYNSLGYDPAATATNSEYGKYNLKAEGKYVEMTRADFDGTFPDAHSMWELSRSDDFFSFSMGRDMYVQDTNASKLPENPTGGVDLWNLVSGEIYEAKEATEGGEQGGTEGGEQGTTPPPATLADTGDTETKNVAFYAEDEVDNSNNLPWVKLASEFTGEDAEYAGWTQQKDAAAQAAAKTAAGDNWIDYFDMAGVDRTDTQITEGKFKGKTGNQAWEDFLNQFTYTDLIKTVSNITNKAIEAVGTPNTPANDSPKNLSSSFDWGDLPHLAAAFDPDLAYQQGVIVGSVSLLKNTGWYAPAMDCHRTAFGGRNNEYYSQDGYHAGIIGAAAVRGAQSKGCATYIKHFALNDQETGRVRCAAIATEQSARELYFKPFQICIQEGNAQHLMASMGNLGDCYIGTSYPVMTEMLRNEWGFTGMAATDAYVSQLDNAPMDLMVRTGMDAPLQDQDKEGTGNRGEGESYLLSGIWDADVNDGQGAVVLTDGEDGCTRISYTQWYCVRKAAENILFANVNSNYVRNGVDTSAFKGTTLTEATQGKVYEASVAVASVTDETAAYTVTAGALPEGLTLGEDGKISGTPTAAGEGKFTVQLSVAGYITATADYTISVGSAFTLDGSSAANALKVGEAYDAYIESDIIKADGEDVTLSYKVGSGALPDGLTLGADDGLIEGTPTAPGTYDVTIVVTETVTQQGGGKGPKGGGSSSESTDYMFDIEFVVTGEGGATSELDAIIERIEALEAAVGSSDVSGEIAAIKADIEALKGAGVSSADIEALEKRLEALEGGGCSGNIASTLVIVGASLALGAVIMGVMLKKKKEQD